MGILDLFKPSGDTISGVLVGAGELAKGIRETITGEGVELQHAELVQASNELEAKLMLASQSTAKTEAQHGNWFQRSWRPGLAWAIILVLMLQYLLFPVLTWIATWAEIAMPPTPAMNVKDLWPIILGLIGYRSFEKVTQQV